MLRRSRFAAFSSILALAFAFNLAFGQPLDAAPQIRPLIVQPVDEATRVTLDGNTRPEANAVNDRGRVADELPMEHMLMLLRRSAEQDRALEQFVDQLHTRDSPNFHQWLTAQQFGERFGLAASDLAAISHWLGSHGFKVNTVYPSGTLIDFSGTAGQVYEAFQTEIHQLDVKGEKHFANMQDPRIPAALSPAVVGVVSLNDFRPRTMYKPRADYTFTSGGATYQAVVPGDLATIYNLQTLFNSGISGQGQTIVVIEDTDVYSTSDWSTFRSTFGLSSFSSGSFSQVHPAPPSGPNNCSDPGVNGDDVEAILDAEYASAAAPSAAIELASCSDTGSTFGGLIALQNLLNESSTPPAVVSISYGECEAANGATANAAYSATYQQAVTEGVSVYVSSGDEGAASCDANLSSATHGIGVSGFASTPYNVAVGGTDFGDSYAGTNSTYWNSTNTSTYESARSYVPEIPWNDSCASELISTVEGYGTTYGASGFCNSVTGSSFLTTASGSGGPSGCATGNPSTSGVVSGSCAGWAKPSWQSVAGNPADGVRDIPDVSLFAANGVWGHYYVFCFTDPSNGGAPCTGAPSGWAGAGGTSFGAPIWAGIQALVNQKTGARQGNPNPVLYQLAASEYGSSGSSSCNSSLGNGAASSCIFYDVKLGDMDVNCNGSFNCYDPSGSYGVLSTTDASYAPAYGTTVGWDFATGIGTVNAANLVNGWPASGPSPNFSLSASPSSLTVAQGTAGTSTISVTPSNGFTGSVTLSASGLPSGVTAAFSPNPATGTSTLTLTVSSTAATGTSTVTVTGTSGSLTHTTSVTLTVGAAPNFGLSASPGSLTITQGTAGTSTISVSPSNGFTGSVTLSASGLPSGVTAAFSPNPTTGTSTLTLTASATAATGTSTVTVTGTSGSQTHTTSVTLTVNPVSTPNFSLSASPGSLTITQGTAGTSTITVSPSNGFTGSVTLSASGLPNGVTAAFNPNPTTGGSTLTLTASSTATTGTATVTVTGTSGSLTHTTSVALTVNASSGGNFTLSASPNSVSVNRGSTARTTITVTPSGGFNGGVSLSASGLPNGVTASFSPDPATSTSTLTFTASSSAPRGTVTVTVTGTSGSLTHTTTVSLRVRRF